MEINTPSRCYIMRDQHQARQRVPAGSSGTTSVRKIKGVSSGVLGEACGVYRGLGDNRKKPQHAKGVAACRDELCVTRPALPSASCRLFYYTIKRKVGRIRTVQHTTVFKSIPPSSLYHFPRTGLFPCIWQHCAPRSDSHCGWDREGGGRELGQGVA